MFVRRKPKARKPRRKASPANLRRCPRCGTNRAFRRTHLRTVLGVPVFACAACGHTKVTR